MEEDLVQPGRSLRAQVAGFLYPAGPVAGQHLEQDHSGGEQVGPGIDLAALALLFGHVRQGARDAGRVAGHAQRLGDGLLRTGGQSAKAEVAQPGHAVPVEQDVGGLHVQVDYARGVHRRQAGQHLLQHRHRPGHGQRPTVQRLAEVPAGHVLHDEIRLFGVRVAAQDADDVGVLDPVQGQALSANEPGVVRVRRDFGGHEPVRPQAVPGLEHLAKRPGPDLLDQDVFAHAVVDCQHGSPSRKQPAIIADRQPRSGGVFPVIRRAGPARRRASDVRR